MDVIVIFELPYVQARGRYRKQGEYARVDAELATTLIADGIARVAFPERKINAHYSIW